MSRTLLAAWLSVCGAFSIGVPPPVSGSSICSSIVCASPRTCPPLLQVEEEAEAAAAAWYDEDTAAAPAAPAPAPPYPDLENTPPPDDDATADSEVPVPPLPREPRVPQPEVLQRSDLENTRWDVKATPREDSWMSGDVRDQEFTLLADDTVVWGGSAGGFGTGGRWTLKDGLLEVTRTTPLGLVTGRDYYMASADVNVNDQLQFKLEGIIRSYNALYPVMVIADFVASRRAGRFVKDISDDDDDK
jgi:hypothetical protein